MGPVDRPGSAPGTAPAPQAGGLEPRPSPDGTAPATHTGEIEPHHRATAGTALATHTGEIDLEPHLATAGTVTTIRAGDPDLEPPATHTGEIDLEPHLATATLARRVELHSTISSTNDRALALARGGAEAGLVVVALSQTAGRGQRGHRWVSPPGAGVYASFLLRPRMPPRIAPALTLVAGAALHKALQPILPVPLGLRWPNDLLVRAPPDRGRKLAGILVEAAASTAQIEHAVVGVGVNLTRVARSPGIDPFITSLEALGAEETGLAPVLGRIANALEAELTSVEREGLAPAAAAWSRHAIGLGKTVVLHDGSTEHRGMLVGLAEDGALVLRTPAGDRPYYRGTLDIPGFRRPPRLG